VKCERASKKEARFFFGSKRSVSFFGFQNERVGKLAVRQAIPPRSFDLFLIENVLMERAGKLAARQAIPPRSFDLFLIENVLMERAGKLAARQAIPPRSFDFSLFYSFNTRPEYAPFWVNLPSYHGDAWGVMFYVFTENHI